MPTRKGVYRIKLFFEAVYVRMVNENISCSDLWIKIVLDELLPFDIAAVVFLGVERKVWKGKVETSVLIHRTAMWVDIVERNYIKPNSEQPN